MVAEPATIFDNLPDAWFKPGEGYEQRHHYYAQVLKRVFDVVFGAGGMPMIMVRDEQVWHQMAVWGWQTGFGKVVDRWLAGLVEKPEIDQAMVAYRDQWARVRADYLRGSPL